MKFKVYNEVKTHPTYNFSDLTSIANYFDGINILSGAQGKTIKKKIAYNSYAARTRYTGAIYNIAESGKEI